MKKRLALFVVLLVVPALLLSGCSAPSLPSLRDFLQERSASGAATAEVPAVATATPPPSSAEPEVAGLEPVEVGDVLEALQDRLGRIYQQVNPSVVNIQIMGSSGGLDSLPFPGHPDLPEGVPQQQGLASGFVWDRDGHIVTNNHVVEGANALTVTFYDGTTVPAKVVGTDKNSDLAVLKVDMPAEALRPVEVADSRALQVGRLAVAIGNPYGLEGTMTVGFISALDRSLPVDSTSLLGSYTIPNIIQTDAPINPGNSGGVLVDDEGRVIGVPTAIESASGSNSGIGFAVPSAIVLKVVPALIAEGKVAYAWLGITGTSLTSEMAEAMGLDRSQRGALVISVTAGGPAEKAGLRGSDRRATVSGGQVQVGGDVIVAIAGEPVQDFDSLVTYLVGRATPGERVRLTILRDGKEQTVEVTLGTRPESEAQAVTGSATPEAGQEERPSTTGSGWLGIQGMTLIPALARAMNLPASQEGVLVILVTPDSPADKAGLRGGSVSVDVEGQSIQVGGDVIVAFDGQVVRDMEALRSMVQAGRPGQRVTLTVLRDGKERDIEVTLGAR